MTCCAAIRARDLRHRVVLEAEAPAPDGGGGQGDPWAAATTIATLRASITPLSGRERLHAQQLEAGVTHRILLRYRPGVTARQRLRFGDRLFNIRAVIDVEERHRWLEILAEEGVAT